MTPHEPTISDRALTLCWFAAVLFFAIPGAVFFAEQLGFIGA